jgi:hypothetical protein
MKVFPLWKEGRIRELTGRWRGGTHVIVFFSVVFGSGRARLRTLRKSDVFARILEWMYAFEHWKRQMRLTQAIGELTGNSP